MTTKQRITILADWWPAACDAKGWNKNDRPLRLQILSQAVARPITSMAELDNGPDIDQVKAYLKFLADDLDGAHETGNREPGERRRYLWLIKRHSSTLVRRHPQPSTLNPQPSAMAYALSVARDRFGTTSGWSTLDDLSTEQLRQLMMTLWARLQSRVAASRQSAPEYDYPDGQDHPAANPCERCGSECNPETGECEECTEREWQRQNQEQEAAKSVFDTADDVPF